MSLSLWEYNVDVLWYCSNVAFEQGDRVMFYVLDEYRCLCPSAACPVPQALGRLCRKESCFDCLPCAEGEISNTTGTITASLYYPWWWAEPWFSTIAQSNYNKIQRSIKVSTNGYSCIFYLTRKTFRLTWLRSLCFFILGEQGGRNKNS